MASREIDLGFPNAFTLWEEDGGEGRVCVCVRRRNSQTSHVHSREKNEAVRLRCWTRCQSSTLDSSDPAPLDHKKLKTKMNVLSGLNRFRTSAPRPCLSSCPYRRFSSPPLACKTHFIPPHTLCNAL